MGDADNDHAPRNGVPEITAYLLGLLPVVLGASEGDLRRDLVGSAGGNHAELAARFIGEAGVQCVYVNKLRVVQAEADPEAASLLLPSSSTATTTSATTTTTHAGQPRTTYTLTTALTWHPANIASLALIKRGQIIDVSRPLADQLHFVNLFGPAPTLSDGSLVSSPATASADGEDVKADHIH